VKYHQSATTCGIRHGMIVDNVQWRSQSLEVGWAQGDWGVQTPEAEPRWGFVGKAPRSQICIYNMQWTNAFSWCVHRRYHIRCTFRLMQSLLPPPLYTF